MILKNTLLVHDICLIFAFIIFTYVVICLNNSNTIQMHDPYLKVIEFSGHHNDNIITLGTSEYYTFNIEGFVNNKSKILIDYDPQVFNRITHNGHNVVTRNFTCKGYIVTKYFTNPANTNVTIILRNLKSNIPVKIITLTIN